MRPVIPQMSKNTRIVLGAWLGLAILLTGCGSSQPTAAPLSTAKFQPGKLEGAGGASGNIPKK